MAIRGQPTNAEGYGSSTSQTPGTNFARGVCDALAVLVGGNATVTLADGSSLAFTGLVAGQILPIRAIQVQNTPPTATLAPLYW